MAFVSREPTHTITPASLFGAASEVPVELLELHLEYAGLLVERGAAGPAVHLKRATALHALGRYEEGIEACDHVLGDDPMNQEATFLRGVCLQLLALQIAGDHFEGPLDADARSLLEEASRCFRTVAAANPEDADAQQYLVNLRCILYS